MPRNASGTMSVPNTFSVGQVANPVTVNENFTDVAGEITASLPRDGRAGMTGPLPLTVGSVSQPSLVFGTDTNTGLYWIEEGVLGFSVNGVRIARLNSQGFVLDNPAQTQVRAHGTVTSGTESFNFNDSPIHSVTQNGNVTFAIANLPDGQDLQINLTYTSGTLAFSNVDRWVLGIDAPSTTFAGTGLNPASLGANSQYTLVFSRVGTRTVGYVVRTL